LFTPTNERVVDLTCSTGSFIWITHAYDKHLLAFEGDNDMFEHILKPLLENDLKEGLSKENIQYLTGEDDDLSNEEPGEITPSYILHTRAFGTYLLEGLFTLQKDYKVMIFYM
jgi:hypothetical protein